jgi:hypothetical protein
VTEAEASLWARTFADERQRMIAIVGWDLRECARRIAAEEADAAVALLRERVTPRSDGPQGVGERRVVAPR